VPDTSGLIRVLGVDPGLADVGYGVIDWMSSSSRATHLTHGVIRTPSTDSLADRLHWIYSELDRLIEEYRPEICSIEQIFFARNVKTAMNVAHGRAACILATARRRCTVVEYTPLQIKQAMTGHGRATKKQIQAMVRSILSLDEIPHPDHASDALAAALCHMHTLGVRSKVAEAVIASGGGNGGSVDPRHELLMQMKTGRRRRKR
jgi:crossover junction endodeoxyribonuclease RuvC